MPLVEGTNFLSLGTRITEDCRPAPDEDYARIPEMVRVFLEKTDARNRIESKNREYFD